MPRPVINVRRKRHPTTPALVMLNDILANLPLYATGCEPKIVQQLAVPSVHCDFSRSAPWALPRSGGADCYVHWQNLATLVALIPSGESPEKKIWPNVYPVALI